MYPHPEYHSSSPGEKLDVCSDFRNNPNGNFPIRFCYLMYPHPGISQLITRKKIDVGSNSRNNPNGSVTN